MVISENEFGNLLVDMRNEEEVKQAQKVRQERIEYEFRLYNHFCSLFGVKACLVSSSNMFLDYCQQKQIELVR